MDTEPASSRVINAVAQKVDVAPEDLSPPLYDAIDPDALDALVASSSTDLRVTFEYHGYEVRVTGDGGVSVVSAEAEETAHIG
ncbi:MAG: HalOD1 output domain-containing protein [Halorhabdus sp.]